MPGCLDSRRTRSIVRSSWGDFRPVSFASPFLSASRSAQAIFVILSGQVTGGSLK